MNIFTPFPELRTARLVLRLMVEADAPEIYQLRSDGRVNRYLDRKAPANMAEVEEFIRRINEGISRNQWIYWAICPAGETQLIGTICLWNFSENPSRSVAEIGYELIPDFQGQGYMNEAMGIILDYGFENLGLKKIEAFTHGDNQQSTRLLERNHFRLESGRKDENNPHHVIYSLTRP